MDGTVDLGACQSPRILIDEDAVRNRVSMWVGGGSGKVCTLENAALDAVSSCIPLFSLHIPICYVSPFLPQINVFDLLWPLILL